MKLKRTTGLLLSLALMSAPAIAAVAKPVASHHLVVSWNSTEAGIFVNGSIDFDDESGTPMIELISTESGLEVCSDGSSGIRTSSMEYHGTTSLDIAIDRHLKTVTISGNLPVNLKVSSTCDGAASVESTTPVVLNLTGLSESRPVRTRDSESGSRIISRWHSFELELDGVPVSSQGMLTKTISRA